MIEGFVYIKERLTKTQCKELLEGQLGQYSVINKKILFCLNDKDRNDLTIKEFVLKKFSFIKDKIDKIIIYNNLDVHIFNHTDDYNW